MGLTLSGVTGDLNDMSPILTKTIVQGFYDFNGTKATFATIGGGTTCAIATRHKIKVIAPGLIKGVPILNDCKTGAGTIAGETGQTDAITAAVGIWFKGVMYPCYVDEGNNDTAASIPAGGRADFYLDGAIPVVPGDEVYVQVAWGGSASTINCPRANYINLNEAEGYLFYDSGVAADDFTNASAQALNTAEWLPIVGNQKKEDMTAQVRYPAPAGLLMEVRANQRHAVIRGTSRSIGGKNWYVDPTLQEDSYVAAACRAKGVPFFNGAVGASIGANDEDNPQYSANRRWLEQGATIVFDEHLQNDLANDYSISDILRRLKIRCAESRNLGRTHVLFTVDPYTTTSETGDWTLSSTQTVADSDTSTKRTSIRTLLKGVVTSLQGTTLAQICDRVLLTSEVVEDSADHTLWEDASVYDTGTATSTSASTLVQSTKTWTPYALHDKYIVGLTAADAVTKGIILTNAQAASSVTSTTATLTSAGWSNGTHGNKAYTIYNTVTNDGLHASYYGNRLKQAVVENYLGGTAASFALTDIPWFDFWIAHPNYLFTDTGCSIPVTDTVAAAVWVGSIRGAKITATDKPTYSSGATYGSLSFNGTSNYMDATSAAGNVMNKQHRYAVVSILEGPNSAGGVKTLFFANSNDGSSTLFKSYYETTLVTALQNRVADDGTNNQDNGSISFTVGQYLVRIDYVSFQEAQSRTWLNGACALDDAAAWSGSAGLSPAAANAAVTLSRSASEFFNAKLLGVGIVNNFEFTPYWVSQLSTLLATPSNWIPSGW